MQNLEALLSELGRSPLKEQANSMDVLPIDKLNAPIDAEPLHHINPDDLKEFKDTEVLPVAELNKPIMHKDIGEVNENSDKTDINPNDEINQSNEGNDAKTSEETTDEIASPKSYKELCETRECGGSYKDVKNEGWGWNDNPPTEVHHMPADSASNLEHGDGPAIAIEYEDHQKTASCGNSKEAQEYRAKQKELIEKGKFREALQMDIDDIRSKFGDKYDEAISQMLTYVDELEKSGKI